MASQSLTTHDIHVLGKIIDPDFNPASGIILDSKKSRDPHITVETEYEGLVRRESSILHTLQQLEMEISREESSIDMDIIPGFKSCVARLAELIEEHPNYASARNNRAQALRRLYGNDMLLIRRSNNSTSLLKNVEEDEARNAAEETLADLDTAISLLTPPSPFHPISSQQAKTLSLAHTQRAAIYLQAAKQKQEAGGIINVGRKESTWDMRQFEEAASRDFALGGRYGCDIAKGLSVSTNPTAKLCGKIVREALKKEYGPEYGR